MKFQSIPIWITGLQELQHLTRVALFQSERKRSMSMKFLSMPIQITALQELQHITKGCTFSKRTP